MSTERKPILSNKTLTIIGLKAAETKYGLHEQCMAIVAAISGVYEAKITSGELMIVKTVTLDGDSKCSGCGHKCVEEHNGIHYQSDYDFCPGCGAKIV